MILDVEDLQGKADTEMKHNVMTYVAAIKNASQREQGKEADKLFNDANALYAQAVSDGRDKATELLEEARTEMLYRVYGDDQSVDEIIASKIGKLSVSYDKFIEAKDLFEKAKDLFKAEKTEAAINMAGKCEERSSMSSKQPDILKEQLQNDLDKLRKEWVARVMLTEGERLSESTVTSLELLIPEIRNWAETEVPKCASEDERAELKKKLKQIFAQKAEPFKDAKNLYASCIQITDDTKMKREITSKLSYIDDLEDEYWQRILSELNAVISKEESQKHAAADDVLSVYHAFSVKCESMIKKLNIDDPGLDRAPGAAERRLTVMMRLVRQHLQRDLNLRQQLHIELDETFTAEKLP